MKRMIYKLILVIIIFFLLTTNLSGINANTVFEESSSSNNQIIDRFVKGEVIVGFKERYVVAKSNSINSLIESYGGKSILSKMEKINAVLVEVKEGEEQDFIDRISSDINVKYAELNGYMYACEIVPNDPLWDRQWGPAAINCGVAWQNFGTGRKNVLIAIVDTGVDYKHEDLKDNYVPLGYDWVNHDDDPMDDHDHGTHCAGIAAAVIDNDKGIAGVAKASIMAEKVMNKKGSGSFENVAQGILHAVEVGADVISMSLGSWWPSEALKDACDYAWNNNVVVVAAAGNVAYFPFGPVWAIAYPAAYDSVIAVGSVGPNLELSWFSCFGSKLELVAPGEDILSSVTGDKYEWYSGTSMACPHVAGVAALIKSLGYKSNKDIRNKLREKAIDLGKEGKDKYYGYGLVDASLTGKKMEDLYRLSVIVHKIKALDPIDVWPDEDPEWYYNLKISTSSYEINHYNYNLETIPKTLMESTYWKHEWQSQKTWYAENVHFFYVDEPVVTVNFSLKDDDFMFDDKADLSSDPDRKTFSICYNLENDSIIQNRSDGVYIMDGWLVADGELDSNGGDDDDARLWFLISGRNENPPRILKVSVKGNQRVGSLLKFGGIVEGGNQPYRWLWNFGDGSTSSKEQPVHAYNNPGIFRVTLTVVDSENLTSNEYTYLIEIIDDKIPPSVEIISPKKGSLYFNDREIMKINIGNNFDCIVIKPMDLKIQAIDDKTGVKDVKVIFDGESYSAQKTNEDNIWEFPIININYNLPEIHTYQAEAFDEFDNKGYSEERKICSIMGNSPPFLYKEIIGPTSGMTGKKYSYSIRFFDVEGDDVYYRIHWDKDTETKWEGPIKTNIVSDTSESPKSQLSTVEAEHIWKKPGTHTITVEVKDSYENHGLYNLTLDVTIDKKSRGRLIPELIQRNDIKILIKNLVTEIFHKKLLLDLFHFILPFYISITNPLTEQK